MFNSEQSHPKFIRLPELHVLVFGSVTELIAWSDRNVEALSSPQKPKECKLFIEVDGAMWAFHSGFYSALKPIYPELTL